MILLNTKKVTGFQKGQYTPEEKDHKYFKSNVHHKLDNLQKEINITKIVMNENLDIKYKNILEGKKPERAIYFLQL